MLHILFKQICKYYKKKIFNENMSQYAIPKSHAFL